MIPSCHPDRPYYSSGMCRSCYDKMRRKRGVTRRVSALPVCNHDRPHFARGLCHPCYEKTRYVANREKVCEKARMRYAADRAPVLGRVREYRTATYRPSPRLRAIHAADSVLESAVWAARASRGGGMLYDEVMLRAMRRRKEAAARIDAEFPASHGGVS